MGPHKQFSKLLSETYQREYPSFTKYRCILIDPFPIIGFYLYHVISADQSNNLTTSGIRSCNNLLLILHAFHLYSLWLKHQTKGKWQLYIPQLHMMTKKIILFQMYPIYAERSLADFYSSSTRDGIYFPQLFPLLPMKALMRFCVSLRVYTIY